MSAKYATWQAMRSQEWHQEVKDLTVTTQQVNFVIHVQSKEAVGYFSREKIFHVFMLPFYTQCFKNTHSESLVMKSTVFTALLESLLRTMSFSDLFKINVTAHCHNVIGHMQMGCSSCLSLPKCSQHQQ
jgi:hypothetical protein